MNSKATQTGAGALTGTEGSIPDELRSNVDGMADGVIELNMVRTGDRLSRNLTVKKIAGHQATMSPAEFRIVAGKGILFRTHRISLLKPRRPKLLRVEVYNRL